MYWKADYVKAIELAAAGKLCLEQLITDRFPFNAYLKAYEYIEHAKDRAMKVMIAVE